MTSDFEKALARAAAERNARDVGQAQQKREHGEKRMLAHSIIDPYLADLGPKAVKALRDLRIPPIDKDRGGERLKNNKDLWEFVYYSSSDDLDRSFLLHKSGTFWRDLSLGKLQPIKVGLLLESREVWPDAIPCSRMLANSGDKKVYVEIGTYHNREFQELTEFIAEYIHHRMRN